MIRLFITKFRLSILLALLPMAGLMASSESYVQSITGHLKKGDSLTVIDDKFLNLSLPEWNRLKHLSIDDIISFELRQDTSLNYYTKSFSCTMNVTIKYYTSRDQQTPKEIDNIDLVVKYDTTRGKSYPDVARYRFKDAFKVTVVINSISSPEWKDKLPDVFRLKSQILVERKYPFDAGKNGSLHLGAFQPLPPSDQLVASGPVLPPSSSYIGLPVVNGTIPISWNTAAFTGAEEFDIEWAFVDAQSRRGIYLAQTFPQNGPYSIPLNTEAEWMQHDATRVTVTSSPYTINLPYLDGYVLVRIRKASYQAVTNLRLTDDWVYTTDDNNTSNTAATYIPSLNDVFNWQYTGSFAEEGKKKEVISYFDGAQRNRQSVTLNNSDNFKDESGNWNPTAVVQETIYDVMGRPTVNMLPGPTRSNSLNFYHGFNLNNAGQPYSYTDITDNSSACTISAGQAGTSAGASQYYSPANTFLSQSTQDENNYYYTKYVPDAGGYPFSVTQYTPDNTGRIRRQGGVGPVLQTGGVSDTKYYYGKPIASDLERLFGMEVGNSSHYIKNMVVDPNGQASVSYIDANGKTIATALAGAAPSTVDPLSTVTAPTHFNDPLIQPADFTVNPAALNMTSSSTFVAELSGDFTVHYSINPLALVTQYGGTNQLCNNCYYTVVVKVTDACGNLAPSTGANPASTTPFQLDDYTCHPTPAAPITQDLTFHASSIGEYTVSYSLQLSNDAINAQTDYYIQHNTDLQKLEDFFTSELNNLDLSSCYNTCDACKSLTSVDDFTARVQGLLSSASFSPLNFSDARIATWITNTYNTLKTRCNGLTCITSPCEQKLTQLEQDVMPGGQYALYDGTALAAGVTTGLFLEPQINVLQNYTSSSLTFTADDGTTKAVSGLNQADFIRAYLAHPEWASYFVTFHIEYCSYLWCKNSDNPTPAVNNEVSYTFDANLQQNVQAGTDAVTAGYYNYADPLALLKKDVWFNGGLGTPYYAQMQSDLQNASNVLSMTPPAQTAKDIIQLLDWLLYCKPSDPNVTQAQAIATWQNCSVNSSCRSATMEWQIYLDYYLQFKSKYYRMAKLAHPSTANCLDCFIGADPLTTIGCTPPGPLTDYTIIQQDVSGTANFYVVYKGGTAPFKGNYTISFAKDNSIGEDPETPPSSPIHTVNVGTGDVQDLAISESTPPNIPPAVSINHYTVYGVTCTPSAVAACAINAANPQAPVDPGPCPDISSFTLSTVETLREVSDPVLLPDHDDVHTDLYYTHTGGPVTRDVTFTVNTTVKLWVATESDGIWGEGLPSITNTTSTVILPAGQTMVKIGTNSDEYHAHPDPVNPQTPPGVPYDETTILVGLVSVSCADVPPPPTPLPASTCTSNPNYALYSGKTRVFNDYSDIQDYNTCNGTAAAATTQQQASATATAAALAAAKDNLNTQQVSWVNYLQSVRDEEKTSFGSISNTTIQSLTNAMAQLSGAYLQIASQSGSPLVISSTLPTGATAPGGYMSYTAIFNGILGSDLVRKGFGADLITNVYPFDKQPVAADLNTLQLPSDISAHVATNLTAFETRFGSSGAGFPAYLAQQLGDDYLMTATQLTDLQNKITAGCTPITLNDPTILPVALTADPAYSGLPNNAITTQVNNFAAVYPNVTVDSKLYQILIVNYINHQTGFALSYSDYAPLIHPDPTHPPDPGQLVYNKPLTATVLNDYFSCSAIQLSQTFARAGQEYDLYITEKRIEFHNAYVSKCLSNQSSANIDGFKQEYHYTLYYYDQSGNLVKTIPPEGVHFLTDQDVTAVEQLPVQDPSSCAAFPSNAITNQNAVLTTLSSDLQNNSALAMEMWLYSNAGTSAQQFRMITPDNKYMCRGVIANNTLWFELYTLSPDGLGTGGIDITNSNQFIAILPPQSALQNWSHLVIQSPGGLATGNLQVYLDGNPLTAVPTASAPPDPFPWEVDGVTGGYTLPAADLGIIQHVRLYNQLIGAADVAADYRNSCLTPVPALSGSSLLLWGIFNIPTFCSNSSGTATAVTVPDKGSLSVTANPDPSGTLGLNHALTDVTNTFTVEFWVNPTAAMNIPNPAYIYAGEDYHPPYAIFPLFGGTSDNQPTGHVNMGVAVGTNGIGVVEHGVMHIPLMLYWQGAVTGWTHVAIVYVDKTPSLYINGVYITTGTTSTQTTVSPSYIFGGSAYGFMTGNLDEVRIWSVARTQQQIAASYNQALASSDQQGLVGYWPMDASSGNLIHDVSCNDHDDTFTPAAESWVTAGAPITETGYVQFANRIIVPNHGLATTYLYNSLNQVVQQTTPDAGTSNFLYDRLGRLSISQNAEQLQPVTVDAANPAGRFSYTRYDVLGRITEVGEKLGAATLSETDARIDATLQSWLGSGSNRQVTVTAYDQAPSWAPAGLIQDNLRKRVSATALLSTGSDPSQNRLAGSYFNYDIDGNVSEQVQENTALIGNEQQFVTGSTGLKDIKYEYDLISGKVNKVLYQDGKWDEFYYQYKYDADNRVVQAFSSRYNYPGTSMWTTEATYRYYLHGPLARMELGKNRVQGVDYAYTLQGWLKGMNGQQLTGFQGPPVDMSGDGAPNTNFSFVGRDVLGYSLGYYQNDYQPIGGTGAAAFNSVYQPSTDPTQGGANLFNGNIGNATYAIGGINNNDGISGFKGYVYRYDQLNRLTGMDSHQIFGGSTWSNTTLAGPVSQRLSYDGNGNMLTNTSSALPNLSYNYHRDANGYLLNNRLRNVGNLDNQGTDNYGYDAIGNLVSDASQSLSRINWTVYGKMASISKGSVSGLQFGYDAGGNRITKASQTVSGTTTTHYVRDAQGNVLAVYQYKANGSGVLTEGDWLEQHLYGSSRLGMVVPHVAILPGQKLGSDAYNAATDGVENAGNHQYELTNHLGNVMATINDILTPGDAFGDKSGHFTLADNLATQLMGQDYYPFGLPSQSSYLGGVAGYRYGFNGKENDNEVEGTGNVIDYGMRVYDPRIGRFFSVDPLREKYPWLSPYQFAENDVIRSIDLDGLEKQIAIDGSVVNGPVNIDVVNASILSNYTKSQQAAMKQASAERYMQDYTRTHPQQTTYPSSSGNLESQGTALRRQFLNDPDNIGGQAAYAIAQNLHDARVSFKEGEWGNGTLNLLNAGINTVTLTGAGPALGVDVKTEVKTEGRVVYADAANPIARREPYVLGPNDLDWRGTGKSFNDALGEAFRRTGVERSEFEVTRWGKGLNGKSIPVEYRAQGGAEVSVDFAHEKNGPDVQHVGWQTPGKGNQMGHILLDEVPAGRSANKLDRSQH